MNKKLTGRELARFEARRDVWQEVLEGVRAKSRPAGASGLRLSRVRRSYERA
jgi:hypothetical protein